MHHIILWIWKKRCFGENHFLMKLQYPFVYKRVYATIPKLDKIELFYSKKKNKISYRYMYPSSNDPLNYRSVFLNFSVLNISRNWSGTEWTFRRRNRRDGEQKGVFCRKRGREGENRTHSLWKRFARNFRSEERGECGRGTGIKAGLILIFKFCGETSPVRRGWEEDRRVREAGREKGASGGRA